jgi:GNAT superfamily N-acetyltransferase
MPSLSHGRGAQRHRPPAGRRRLSAEAGQVAKATRIDVRPLTPTRWPDLEAIFEAKGCSLARGCWCMAYRVSGSAPALPPGTTRARVWRDALKALVNAGRPPGLVGYRGRTPVGWVSIGPRDDYAKLRRSPVMKAVDDVPVWSIVCFVVPAQYRGQGFARQLLKGAIDYATRRGATVVEAYPVDKLGRCADEAMWFGSKSMFDAAGFEEVARRKATRPVVRLRIG